MAIEGRGVVKNFRLHEVISTERTRPLQWWTSTRPFRDGNKVLLGTGQGQRCVVGIGFVIAGSGFESTLIVKFTYAVMTGNFSAKFGHGRKTKKRQVGIGKRDDRGD